MKLFTQPYTSLLKLTKDAVRDVMAPLRANEMKLKAQTKLAELASKHAEATQKIVELGSVYPIDFDKLVSAMDEAALIARRKEQLELIIGDLFPTEGA